MWQGMVDGLGLESGHSQQPARKLGPQSYGGKELNSTTNLKEPGRGLQASDEIAGFIPAM